MKEKGKMKSEKVWTSLLLTFSLLLFTSAAQAENEVNASHCFLSLTGIDGDSKDLNHEMWIDAMWIYVIDARFDSSETEMTDILEVADGRDGAGMVKIKHLVSSATTKIQDAYLRGTIIDGGCINYQIGGQQDLVLSYILEGVKVVKSEIEVENLPTGEFVLVEKDDLSVEKIIKNEEGVSPREVSVGDHSHLTAAYTSGRGTVTNAIDGMSFKVPAGTKHVKVIFTADDGYEIIGENVVEIETVIKNIVFGEGNDYRVPEVRDTSNYIPYRDYDASTGTFTNAVSACALVTGETRVLEGGWWAVEDEVVIPDGTNLTVIGSAHLILCDGASLTVSGGRFLAGVSVSSGNELTIYGQTDGTGTLTAGGGMGGAGIGGGGSQGGGTVTINGGMIEAFGGADAAGIGGGKDGNGGVVTITGGKVMAIAGENASDIGGGLKTETSGEVSISGGLFARKPKDEWLVPECLVRETGDQLWPYAVSRRTGVTVNGDDCAKGVGDGWMWDAVSSNLVFLSNAGFVLSGSSTDGGFHMTVGANFSPMLVLSNLTVRTTASVPVLTVGLNANASVTYDGTNVLEATGADIIQSDGKLSVLAVDRSEDGDPLALLALRGNRLADPSAAGITFGLGRYALTSKAFIPESRIEPHFLITELSETWEDQKVCRIQPSVGIRVNGVDITLGSGSDWTFSEQQLQITPTTVSRFVIEGYSTSGIRIVVDSAALASCLCLSNVTLKTELADAGSPIEIAAGRVTLEPVETCKIVSGNPGYAAIHVASGAELILPNRAGENDAFLLSIPSSSSAAFIGANAQTPAGATAPGSCSARVAILRVPSRA